MSDGVVGLDVLESDGVIAFGDTVIVVFLEL